MREDRLIHTHDLNHSRLVVTGGGTGGHVYPALALATEYRRRHTHAAILYVGSRRGLETRVVPRTGLEFVGLSVGGVVGKTAPVKVYGALSTAYSVLRSVGILRHFRPDVVLGTGGYVSVPVVMAAQLMGIPTLLQEQNVIPGMANRLLAHRANHLFLPSKKALKALPAGVQAKAIVAGNPVRKEFSLVERALARREYGIDDSETLLVIMSGSGGAATINRVAAEWMSRLEEPPPGLRVLFGTGKRYYRTVVEEIGHIPKWTAVVEYIDDAPGALAAADLLLCRAGAMTLAEATVMGVPMIIVPSPNVAHQHQLANAKALEEAGAAIALEDEDFDADILDQSVRQLLADSSRLGQMARASREHGDPQALDRMVNTIEEIVAKGEG
ncbi:MAG: undecaprenyldiphospho-muramoylpentapeptide beta-N-acetylglucosaminyltransferase, partial [Bacillota bacterium]